MFFITAITVLIVTGFFNLILLTVIHSQSKNYTPLHYVFSFHIISIAAWSTSLALLLLFAESQNFPTYTVNTAGFVLAQAVFISATALFISNYWFVHIFINGKRVINKFSILILVIQVIGALLCLIPGALFVSFSVETGGYISVIPGPLEGLYSIFLLTHLICPIYMLFRAKNQQTNSNRRYQMRVLASFYAIFLFLSISANWILPVYFNIFYFNSYGPTTSLVLVGGIIYAVLRYEFLDLKIVIQRSLIYSLLLTFIIVIYTLIATFTSHFFSKKEPILLDEILFGVLSIIVSLITVPKLDQWLRKVTDKILYSDTYLYQDTLHDLSIALRDNTDLNTIVKTSEDKLAQIFRSTYIAIGRSESRPADIVISIPGSDGANIYVGPKRSGAKYTSDDIKLLETFSNQAAIAISRSLLFTEISNYASTLEKRVTDRVEDIKTIQEAQRTSMLQLSHNLQTPLTILRNNLESLRHHIKPDQFTVLEHSISDTSQFISRLLKLARLESGQEKINNTTFSLSNFINDIIAETNIIAESQSRQVIGEVISNLSISSDPLYLREILLNIISNAIKYSDENSTIILKLNRHHSQVKITCSNTGSFIPLSDRKRLFTPFYRREEHNNIKGTGLGLAITKQMVELLKGTISVKSHKKNGTSIIISLPVLCDK